VYFPEEIAHAAGLLPINVLGGGNRLELKHADAHMGSFVCSICRSTAELGLNGSLQGLTGFITHPICDASKHLAGIWARNFPEQLAQILYLPQNVNTPGAVRYIASEYQRLRGELEKRTGRSIDDEALRASIRFYNQNRRLLRELYALRRDEPWKPDNRNRCCRLLCRSVSRRNQNKGRWSRCRKNWCSGFDLKVEW